MKKRSIAFWGCISLACIALLFGITMLFPHSELILNATKVALTFVAMLTMGECFKLWIERPRIYKLGRLRVRVVDTLREVEECMARGNYNVVVMQFRSKKTSRIFVDLEALAEELNANFGWQRDEFFGIKKLALTAPLGYKDVIAFLGELPP